MPWETRLAIGDYIGLLWSPSAGGSSPSTEQSSAVGALERTLNITDMAGGERGLQSSGYSTNRTEDESSASWTWTLSPGVWIEEKPHEDEHEHGKHRTLIWCEVKRRAVCGRFWWQFRRGGCFWL